MKKLIAASLFCAAATFAAPSYATVGFSDVVNVEDDFYGSFNGVIPEGGPEAELSWESAVYGAPLAIYLTEPGTGIISDVLYSLGDPGGDGDVLHFVSDGGSHPALGQSCSAFADNPTLQCVEETGALQDVSDIIGVFISDWTHGEFTEIYDGGSFVQIQSDVGPDGDVTAAPEPATLAILGLGLAGLGLMRRKRAG